MIVKPLTIVCLDLNIGVVEVELLKTSKTTSNDPAVIAANAVNTSGIVPSIKTLLPLVVKGNVKLPIVTGVPMPATRVGIGTGIAVVPVIETKLVGVSIKKGVAMN